MGDFGPLILEADSAQTAVAVNLPGTEFAVKLGAKKQSAGKQLYPTFRDPLQN